MDVICIQILRIIFCNVNATKKIQYILLLIPPGTSADASADASADVSSDAAAEIYHRIKNAANTHIYSTMHLLLSL